MCRDGTSMMRCEIAEKIRHIHSLSLKHFFDLRYVRAAVTEHG